MIYADGLCSLCKRYHLPASEHKDDCPEQPRVFWSRESEQLYLRRRDMELRHTIEDRERRKEEERLEREHGKVRALLREHLQLWHQERSAEIAAQAERLRGELSAARAQHAQQARAKRLERNLQQRERRRDG
jgi:hypothetical protein